MLFSSIFAFSVIASSLGSPALLAPREDWKTALGWDGKTASPADLDPSNKSNGKANVAALNGGVFFCNEANFGKPCLYVAGFEPNQCVSFGPDFNDQVTSFGPDPGLSCLPYSDWGCQGTTPGGYFVNPGSSNLAQQNFDNKASSFACKAT